MDVKRKTYIEINLKHVEYNYCLIKSMISSSTKVAAVVKANAYGHGSLEVSKVLEKCGVDYLCVALAEEGVYLRNNDIKSPILVLGTLNEMGMREAAQNKLDISIGSLHELQQLLGVLYSEHLTAQVHLVADTGMHRDGFDQLQDWCQAIETIATTNLIKIVGAYTHLADAENTNFQYTNLQLSKFASFTAALPPNTIVHCAASSGIVMCPDSIFDMVRPGILLYGYAPYEDEFPGLKPVMSVYSELTALRTIKKGQSVGYNCTFVAENDTMIGTVSIGYGDGYSRKLSNLGHVIVQGKLCKIIGRVCMDQIMIDLSSVENPVIGDKVVIIGTDGNYSITAADIAELIGTIPYEVLVSHTARLPYAYKG